MFESSGMTEPTMPEYPAGRKEDRSSIGHLTSSSAAARAPRSTTGETAGTAAGIISVAGNVAPRPMRALCDHARGGRLVEAEAIHRALMPLFKALFMESNPGPVKFLMSAMGLIENELRLPLVPVEPASERAILEAARASGVALPEPASAART